MDIEEYEVTVHDLLRQCKAFCEYIEMHEELPGVEGSFGDLMAILRVKHAAFNTDEARIQMRLGKLEVAARYYHAADDILRN